ncbi:flagellar biosynthesis protein FlhF [Paenibacillus silviterrae]|uniref:flagellar biosynthesis protein FlhF n=1 Tax=Paenibacillus silviterrae TaxID=3242194 RepID=UPI002542E3D0|nr:flagellar biosynthesis protein FlhF [Paenibacillus chinjuensis]
MRVKRYVVDSMPDALQKIRTDLGKDAVILNTKEIRSGGFLGLFSKKKIEVIAATDTAAAVGGAGVPSPIGTGKQPQQAQMQNPIIPPVQSSSKPAFASMLQEERASLSFPEVPDVFPTASTGSTQVSIPTMVKQAPTAVKPREDALLEELKQMKEMMHKLSKMSLQQPELDPLLLELEQRLIDQELEPLLIQRLIARVQEEVESEGTSLTKEAAIASLKKQLLEILVPSQSKPISPHTQIAHFVGPTGVGKTTTIAKLAAEQVLKYGRKVGFITSDTYRIAAVEQLKTYATILNVPLEVVFSPLDLNKAFEQLKDRDIIFMDTAGRNFRNEMYVSELNALLQSRGQSETFLVLSLTTKYKDMKAITENFSKFKLDKVLFTKMDETDSFGPIVNLIHEFQLQLSYMTNGQSVPDDIVELDEKHIIDLILEDYKHE